MVTMMMMMLMIMLLLLLLMMMVVVVVVVVLGIVCLLSDEGRHVNSGFFSVFFLGHHTRYNKIIPGVCASYPQLMSAVINRVIL